MMLGRMLLLILLAQTTHIKLNHIETDGIYRGPMIHGKFPKRNLGKNLTDFIGPYTNSFTNDCDALIKVKRRPGNVKAYLSFTSI